MMLFPEWLVMIIMCTRSSPRPQTISPPPSSAATPILSSPETLVNGDTDLRTFREALVMSPLSRKPRGPELCAFITGEIARHCKRPASPSDVTMDSPTHQKRQRFMWNIQDDINQHHRRPVLTLSLTIY